MAHPAGQQDEQPSIAEPPACIGQIAQPAPELGIRRPAELIPDAGPIGGDDGAGPPLAHLEHRPKMSDSLALYGGPYPFFPRSSRRAEASSIDSASSFFSLPFSSSSARSRLASETSIPPNLAFQLYSVASDIPYFRQSSPAFAPASCSRNTAMICSSVNLLRFIGPSLVQAGLYLLVEEYLMAGQFHLIGTRSGVQMAGKE